MMEEYDKGEAEEYGDASIASFDSPVPLWLKCTYLFLPIWGVICLYLYWNGSQGWLDRGYWQQLQRAAQTTFPFKNAEKSDEYTFTRP